jgi:hypothetical protein
MSKRVLAVFGLVMAGLLLVTGTVQADKIKIEKLDDLPRHTYTIDVKAAELFDDNTALMKLAAEVKKDLLADLETYEIEDKTTLQGYYVNLGTVALLEKDWAEYFRLLDLRKQLEEKEALRLTTGLFGRAFVKAVQSPGDDLGTAFRREFAALVEALPFDVVESQIKSMKGGAEIRSEAFVVGLADSRVQPVLDESGGEMSKGLATRMLTYGHIIRNFLPLKSIVIDVLATYLDTHKVEKPDIWAEREVALTAEDEASPVVVAVWDSGTDPEVYGDLMWTNEAEIPGNEIDDDNNGFVDDVHGIAFTLHSEKTPELLFPIGDIQAERPRLQRQTKGLSDITANIDSEEAQELRKYMANLDPAEVQPFIEDITKYGNYAHGTHVGGIAVRDNHHVRLLTARITFDHHMIPECPTVEQARKDSLATVETIRYFRDNAVRVVNMSWGGSLSMVEAALEANNAGGTPEERKKLARQIFEIGKTGLYKAMEDAPDILFITSAGNENSDVVFDEVIPSSFDFANIMSVGAVDQAGDETSFTSFGKVDVYANGYEVASHVPGGDEMNMSGTSQASPNVTNLAAKLFALRPDLTPLQVRELIEKGADEKTVGERSVRLMNPKRTLELLAEMK